MNGDSDDIDADDNDNDAALFWFYPFHLSLVFNYFWLIAHQLDLF